MSLPKLTFELCSWKKQIECQKWWLSHVNIFKIELYTCFGSYPVANDKRIYSMKTKYGGRGLAFDGRTNWVLGNNFTKNVIFGADNDTLRHSRNKNNSFIVLGERPSKVENT